MAVAPADSKLYEREIKSNKKMKKSQCRECVCVCVDQTKICRNWKMLLYNSYIFEWLA